jgi:hypothetical protein
MLSTALELSRWIVHAGVPGTRLLTGLVLTLLFTLLARRMRGVSVSGAIAGFVVSLILYVLAGLEAFAVLVCVFVLTWLATRFDYGEKKRRGTAEQSGGRTASQVVANLGVATIAVLVFRCPEEFDLPAGRHLSPFRSRRRYCFQRIWTGAGRQPAADHNVDHRSTGDRWRPERNWNTCGSGRCTDCQ